MAQFIDINPAPINSLAYFDMAERASSSVAAGQRAGLENALAIREVTRDEMTRNALAAYMEAPEEGRSAAFNQLLAANPAVANDVMTVQNAQADREALQRRSHAVAALTELQAIKRLENPAQGFRLMAERPGDNPLRGLMDKLAEQGAINLEDGISDEEAATIADLAIPELTAIAGMQDDERAAPAAIREMEALGYELTPEGFAQYNADRGSPGGTAADQLALIQAQLAIDQRRDQLERDRRADEQASAEREKQRTTTRNAIRRGVAQTGKIADLTKKLEGSFLEVGVPASTLRRTGAGLLAGLGAAVGVPTDKLRADLDYYDQLKKNFSDQLLNLMSSGNFSNQTNALLEQYQNALASTETSPGAIMAIQANIAETLLDEADAHGLDPFDGTPKERAARRAEIEADIERWRHYETPAGEPVVDAPAIAARVREIGSMTIEQLQSLDLGNMAPELIEAAADRWDALNAAGK